MVLNYCRLWRRRVGIGLLTVVIVWSTRLIRGFEMDWLLSTCSGCLTFFCCSRSWRDCYSNELGGWQFKVFEIVGGGAQILDTHGVTVLVVVLHYCCVVLDRRSFFRRNPGRQAGTTGQVLEKWAVARV